MNPGFKDNKLRAPPHPSVDVICAYMPPKVVVGEGGEKWRKEGRKEERVVTFRLALSLALSLYVSEIPIT